MQRRGDFLISLVLQRVFAVRSYKAGSAASCGSVTRRLRYHLVLRSRHKFEGVTTTQAPAPRHRRVARCRSFIREPALRAPYAPQIAAQGGAVPEHHRFKPRTMYSAPLRTRQQVPAIGQSDLAVTDFPRQPHNSIAMISTPPYHTEAPDIQVTYAVQCISSKDQMRSCLKAQALRLAELSASRARSL